ncbi:MAG: tRNA pseudouridine(55) synthase TruB [Pseudoflavonifractor sp.]|nr:tRNA pseudouridine(55) synthase TruB [Alloprevotella sp.]MCM1115988.1 tRNA pseudouridine(55) synthase TruB [Pseudoflavonifractor sp.]
MVTGSAPIDGLSPRDYISGEIFAVDKPLGWTSFDVVKRLRGAILRRLGVKKFKVGHAGTLDPLASGLMIVTTGRATKLIDSLQAGVKEYEATLSLGATTPSFDLETEIDATFPTSHVTRPLIDSIIPRFLGAIEQVPPAFSACKVDGKRAYELARKGREVELKPKLLVIDSIEVTSFDPEAMSLSLRIICSKGTYIRALARDIGEALGCGAHLTALRRTRVGSYSLSDALTVDGAVELIKETPFIIPDDNNK